MAKRKKSKNQLKKNKKRATNKGPFSRVSRAATRRIPNAPPIPTVCRYCSSKVKRKSRKYICTNKACQASVGIHKNTNIPYGPLADAELRKARQYGHRLLDAIQKYDAFENQREAYAWLADEMGLTQADCTWGRFVLEQAYMAIELCRTKLAELKGSEATTHDAGSAPYSEDLTVREPITWMLDPPNATSRDVETISVPA